MGSKQDRRDDEMVPIEDGLELMRAFHRIASAEFRRKVISLAASLAPKEK